MQNPRDENRVTTISGVSSADGKTPVVPYVDPVTHRLLVNASGGSGTGTVTDVSVVTANGVSGSVATSTTTPAITINLGAITPSSVNSVVVSGSATPTLAVTGTSSISGANTGDQTGGTPAITLGTANTAGSSPNFLRRDDTILAFDATAPSTQAFGDAAAVGAATVAARRDHKHAMMAAPTSVTGNAGTVTNATLTTALTIDTGTVKLHGNAANTSELTLGAGAITINGTATKVYTLPSVDASLAPLTSPSFTTPNLGTPSAGTLTSCTGLPITGLVASTSTALGVGSIELGNASDTTIARVSAGVVSIEGVNIDTVSGTQTLTNKRITPRVLSAASYTTDTGTSLNCDNLDIFIVTAQAGALKFNNPTGTPTDGQKLWIAVTGTAARALTYDTQFEASAGSALPTTTVTTARLDIGFVWRADTSKWHCVASA
jgi:hypothetical protein